MMITILQEKQLRRWIGAHSMERSFRWNPQKSMAEEAPHQMINVGTAIDMVIGPMNAEKEGAVGAGMLCAGKAGVICVVTEVTNREIVPAEDQDLEVVVVPDHLHTQADILVEEGQEETTKEIPEGDTDQDKAADQAVVIAEKAAEKSQQITGVDQETNQLIKLKMKVSLDPPQNPATATGIPAERSRVRKSKISLKRMER